ncbi:xylan glycosyltransferase MUCI21-like [Spinacia oleracea]|uniref:Xylan glycosyltransferase MUCI21-like n=1 Tax=Spinacia oleracea TaxID=3562 RepID=A0ABM3QYW3_SPIOL|nr:xylan glycosyltransferase MUCI21-like [Spinacia oleracea]
MKKRSFDSSNATAISFMVVLLLSIFSVLYIYYGASFPRFNHLSSFSNSPSLPKKYQDQSDQKEKPITKWDPILQDESQISCDLSHYHYDLCSINSPTVLDPITSTFYVIGPKSPRNFIHKIRPYPRKWENLTMLKVKEITLISGPRSPKCDIIHNTTALVFSAGGYTGNFFHDFNDGFLPLFITIRSMSLSNQDVVLVIEKSRDWWVSKYSDLLGAFSNYPILNLDNENITHCFTSATLGLISHGFMTIKPKLMPKPTTLLDFHFFLNKAYSKAQQSNSLREVDRPKLVLFSRSGGVGRVILNEVEIKNMAENIGFNVIIFEPNHRTSMSEAHGLINDSHVAVGVHGAALTHFLFLRPGSIFIQVIPIGVDEVAEMCFGGPAKEMGLTYLEYKIRIEESSLIKKYNKLDPILVDPLASNKNWWALLGRVYLKEQNVELDLIRFRKYLNYAYKKAKRSMYKG